MFSPIMHQCFGKKGFLFQLEWVFLLHGSSFIKFTHLLILTPKGGFIMTVKFMAVNNQAWV